MKNKKLNNVLKALVIGVTVASIGTGVYVKTTYAASASKPSINGRECEKEKGCKVKFSESDEGCKRHIKRNNMDSLKASLNELVNEGTLTQEKADKVISRLQKRKDGRKTEFEKMKKMTEEERKEYVKNKKEKYINPFDEMIKDGIITKSEAEAITSRNREKMSLERKEKITENLSNLVKDKTITQEQMNKFIEKFEKQQVERKALHKKLRGMSEEERKTYMDKKEFKRKSDILKEMVKEGTITSQQAEAMQKVMPKIYKKN